MFRLFVFPIGTHLRIINLSCQPVQCSGSSVCSCIYIYLCLQGLIILFKLYCVVAKSSTKSNPDPIQRIHFMPCIHGYWMADKWKDVLYLYTHTYVHIFLVPRLSTGHVHMYTLLEWYELYDNIACMHPICTSGKT